MIFDFNNFLSKNKNSVFSKSLYNILLNIDDNISKYLIENKFDEISFIDKTDKNDTLSFILNKNLNKIKDPWNNNTRQEIKVGRFIKRIVKDEFNEKQIEIFVNLYKSEYDFEKYEKFFDIVKGEDITKYYLYRNQIQGGQLSKSCMGSKDQQIFIKDFYERNPQKINMLILRYEENPDYIMGRANLWILDNPKDRIFMDRIYTNDDFLINIFIKYAEKNNYIYKKRQIYGGNVIPVIDNKVEKKLIMSTELKPLNYDFYPYVDTLQFYNRKTGEITNDTSKWYLTEKGNDWIALIHAGGEYLTIDNDQNFKMDYLGRLVHSFYVKWSNIDNCYIHINDAIYLKYIDDYCRPDREIVDIDGSLYLKEDVFFDEENNKYIIKKNDIK